MSLNKPLLLDANVLIDYAKTDDSILQLATQHLGPIYIPDPVVEEVDELRQDDYDRLGLIIVEPTTHQMFAAAIQGWTSKMADALCFILAQSNRWICVTSDRRVRKQCIDNGVSTLWGTQLMLELIKIDQLQAEEAITVMQMIQETNPYIRSAIVEAFTSEARHLSTNQKGE